jgi:hypothetical protein
LIAETQYELDQDRINNQTKSKSDDATPEKAIKPTGHSSRNIYRYQINEKTALGLLKEPLLELIFDPSKDADPEIDKLKKLLMRSKAAVQPGQHYDRHKLKRNRRKQHIEDQAIGMRNKNSPI